MDRRHILIRGAAFGALAFGAPLSARFACAQSREETLRVLTDSIPNSQDPQGVGVSRASLAVFANVYDRLINFGRREVKPGLYRYDYSRFEGELAESWEELGDGRTLIFHLRKGATFHDGSPVTAEDVRWSLERGVSLPASKNQLATGSIKEASQFTVIDPQTIRLTFERKDRLTLPNLALSSAAVLNSTLAKQHATPTDPWATEWVRNNAAGGGAYKIETWNPSQQVVYAAFEDWKSGSRPFIRRAIVQVAPSAETRVATLLKGDADIALQLPARDIDALAKDKRADVISLPVTNAFRFIAFNSKAKPFDDVRVRQAIAYALPYRDLLQASVAGHAQPLFGAASATPKEATFPQAYPYDTDLDKAKKLLNDAGLSEGFETSFSYNVSDSTLADPIGPLVQESLARIGVKVTIDKLPEAQWGAALTARKVAFYTDNSSAWFADPDYFFRIFFQGDWRWNFGNFDDPELNALVNAARWERDPSKYDEAIRKAIAIAFDKVPLLPLWLPSYEAALRPGLTDFTYYIHGQVDFRSLKRS